jgi:predicted alpha-1,2-mannosidase
MNAALCALLCLGLGAAGPAKPRPSALVDPFIGTGGHGHTFPGPSMPFGMVQPSPDTRLTGWDGCSAYHASDRVIYGFSQTHLSGTGCSDYGDILLLPFTGPVKWKCGYTTKGEDPGPFDPSGYGSHFRKATEKAEAGYYAVYLDDTGVDAELTATTRVAFHRYRFAGEDAQVLVDLHHRDETLDAWIRVVDDHTVEGFRRAKAWAVDRPVYFVAVFDHPFTATVASGDEPLPGARKAEGQNLKAALRFHLRPHEALQVKVALSAVGLDGARKNLRAELPGWDFTKTRAAARAAWDKELSKIEIDGGSGAQRKVFYTALYHTLLQPNTFQDVDGRYLGRDLKVHRAARGSTRYTVFSLWDTFRAAHPLYTLIEPQRDQDFVRTFLGEYQEGGRLPVWELWGNETNCMIGYHAVPVIVDAWMKGLRGFDPELALKAMVRSADEDSRGLAAYRANGYIPGESEPEDVSQTLEYAYDDWCIARFAESLGHPDLAARFDLRAQGWKHLLDADGFMHPRLHGRFKAPFDPSEVDNHFTEANSWQYSFFVPQDLDGLIARDGGDAAFCRHLDGLFTASVKTTGREQADITGLIGQYAHGNEPSHHMAYLYDYAGQPWKAQALVRRIMDSFYPDDPDGLIGNEDCGQMSAWFVLSSLGLYQVCPGRPDWAIGSPLFPKATLHLGKASLRIRVMGSGPYLQACALNGAAHPACFLTQEELTKGGDLAFRMGFHPSAWGSAPEDRPQSHRSGRLVIAAPICEAPRFFSAPVQAKLLALEPGSRIFWTLDGTTPDARAAPYAGPLTLTESCTLRFRAEKGGLWSPVVAADFHFLDPARKLTLRTPFHPQYDGGGPDALIDGVRGTAAWRTGGWQGFYGTDLEAELDLGAVKPLHRLALGCLQDQNAWIFMPLSASFQISEDGTAWKDAGTAENATDPHADGAILRDFAVTLDARARYIRVHAKAPILCPPWHKGAGEKSFIFCDELVAE